MKPPAAALASGLTWRTAVKLAGALKMREWKMQDWKMEE